MDAHQASPLEQPLEHARDRMRDRIIAAAAQILHAEGREAVSVRAVCAAAGVQAPTIYRLFGDKQGLIDAVAQDGMLSYLRGRLDLEPLADPVDELRAGWDGQVRFGLANPEIYPLIYGDRRAGVIPPAVVASAATVRGKVHRVAEAGRLVVPEDRAVNLLLAAGSGVVLWLIAQPGTDHDLALSAALRDIVINAITTDTPVSHHPGVVAAAVALRAELPHTTALTDQERALLEQWLDRISVDGGDAGADERRVSRPARSAGTPQ
jgi:AcrR family transcriptional regulator